MMLKLTVKRRRPTKVRVPKRRFKRPQYFLLGVNDSGMRMCKHGYVHVNSGNDIVVWHAFHWVTGGSKHCFQSMHEPFAFDAPWLQIWNLNTTRSFKLQIQLEQFVCIYKFIRRKLTVKRHTHIHSDGIVGCKLVLPHEMPGTKNRHQEKLKIRETARERHAY